MKKLLLFEIHKLISNNPELSEMIKNDIEDNATIKLAKLGMHFEKESYREKLANSFRDMVAMGRSPTIKGMNQFQSFNYLRNTSMYPSFDDYNKMTRYKKNLFNQSLIDDLQSVFRGGKNSVAFKNFMTKGLGARYNPQKQIWENIGDFNKNQYNRFFNKHKTHYPSLDREAKGIIRGLYNRVKDTNNKIKSYNHHNNTSLPKIIIGNGAKQIARHTKLNEKQINDILENKACGGVSFPKGTVGNNNIIVGVNNNPLATLKEQLNSLYKENKKLVSINPSEDKRFSQPGANIAHKAKLLSHEFNESLNELDFLKKKRAMQPDVRRLGMSNLFNDSHMSGHVLGNEFLINNKLYGCQMGTPEFKIRAYDSSYPDVNAEYIGNEAISNPNNSLVANTIGLNYSKLDGGFDRFRKPKQLNKFLNKNMKATNNFFDEMQQYVDPVEVWLYRNVYGYKPKTRIFKVQTNQLLEALNNYFPHMIYPSSLNSDYDKLVNYYISLYLSNN